MIKLGIISYLNTLPVYYAIEKGMVSLPPYIKVVKDVPSTLNRMLSTGELDVAVISAFEYGLHYREYVILPELCIGANGKVMSVLFFSTVPMERLHKKEVFLTRASLTSKNLLIHLFRKIGISPIYREFSLEEGIPENNYTGILLIGDDALRMLNSKRFSYVYDLAEVWKNLYGTPFVFALWCARKRAYEKEPEKVKECWRRLLLSKEKSRFMYEDIAREKAKELGLDQRECLNYLNTLHFDLKEPYIEGLKLYFDEMHRGGLLVEKPELVFATD